MNNPLTPLDELALWVALAEYEHSSKESRARVKHAAGEAKASDRRKRQGFG